MPRSIFGFIAAFLLALASAPDADAQEWRPPSRTMPMMPAAADLSPRWLASTDWFRGVAEVSGVVAADLRVAGEGRGSESAQVVRVTSGPVPVVVWQDRNADGRADLIEIFRGGGVMIQVIDADYDGQANVLRRYDQAGTLSNEERL